MPSSWIALDEAVQLRLVADGARENRRSRDCASNRMPSNSAAK